MIDLHLHTHYSDGTLSPEKLVELAKEKGAAAIAITDHDGMKGIKEGLEAGKKYSVRVIPGIELSIEDEDKAYMHILGYGIDRDNQDLKEEVELIRQKRVERNEKMLKALNEIGCRITKDDLKLRSEQDYVGKPIFAIALVNKGYISSPKEAFAEGKFMRSETVRRIHREKISAKKAIQLIKGAGGIAVLAHPMKIANLGDSSDGFFEKLDNLLIKLKSIGLDGVECYYSKHILYETERLVEMANKHKLLITAGSDFHGPQYDENLTIGTYPKDSCFNENKIINEINNRILYKEV